MYPESADIYEWKRKKRKASPMSVSLVTGSSDTGSISQILSLSSAATTQAASTGASSDLDTVSISASGSASSQLAALMQQRQSLMASRAELVGSTMESDGSTDAIQNQLEEYDRQLEDIDAQIAQLKAQVAGEQAQSVVTYSKSSSAKNTGGSNSGLNSVLGLAASYTSAQTAAGVQKKLDRQAEALATEIDADRSRGVDTSDKEGVLSELTARSAGASATLSASLNDINRRIMKSGGDLLVELDYPTVSSTAYSSAASAVGDAEAVPTDEA